MNNIIIYALGRSGSKWLVDHLQETTGLTTPDDVADGEIYSWRCLNQQQHVQNAILDGNRIIKVLVHQKEDALSDFQGNYRHVYFNARKNLVDSVLSWYVGWQSNISSAPHYIGWHKNFSEPQTVAFDASVLRTTIHTCLASRKKFIHNLHNYTTDNYSLVFTEDLPQHEKLHRPVILDRHDEIIPYIQQYESQDPIALYQHYDTAKILKFDN